MLKKGKIGIIIIRDAVNILYCMTSEIGGNVPNQFLNLMGLWQNYLIYRVDVSRNFYENAIRINEQLLKALWEPWIKAGNPQ